jgi:hypothetical protein
MSAAEDLILTITSAGTGRLSSSHDYTVRGRGGQGIFAMSQKHLADTRSTLVASFPVQHGRPDHARHLARPVDPLPVDGISFRSVAGGVKVFNTGPGRKSSRSPGSPIRRGGIGLDVWLPFIFLVGCIGRRDHPLHGLHGRRHLPAAASYRRLERPDRGRDREAGCSQRPTCRNAVERQPLERIAVALERPRKLICR